MHPWLLRGFKYNFIFNTFTAKHMAVCACYHHHPYHIMLVHNHSFNSLQDLRFSWW
jgi:hypothetical protein